MNSTLPPRIRTLRWSSSAALIISFGVLLGLANLATTEQEVLAYTLLGRQWDSPEVGYRVEPNFTDPAAGQSSQQTNAINRAADTWCREGQSNFSFRFDGETSNAGVAADGINTVQYSNTDGGGALAICYSWFVGSRITNFDIEYYDRDGVFDFVWALNPNGSQFDIEGVGTHEFGHALGLGHSNVMGATMYASVSPGDIGPRTLSADDIAGVQAIYGAANCGNPVMITNISPNTGSAAGGTQVSISGAGFLQGWTGVYFQGTLASNISIQSDTLLTCVTPSQPGGAGSMASVVVNKPAGSATVNPGFTWQAPAVSVTSISPSSGSSYGGTSVTINGSGFAAGWTGVYFSGELASQIQVINDTTLTCVTPPANSPGASTVVVNKPAGFGKLDAGFSYQSQPVGVTSVSPSSGTLQGGTQVTITGGGFSGGWTGVYFNGVDATNIQVQSDTSLTCVTPPSNDPGLALVVVNKPAGQGIRDDLFTYQTAAPTISSILPTAGPTSGGTEVIIQGSGFAAGWSGVYFGGVLATNLVILSDTQLRCNTPQASNTGPVSVVVNKPAGYAIRNPGFTYTLGQPASAAATPSSPSVSHHHKLQNPNLQASRTGFEVTLLLEGGVPGAPFILAFDSDRAPDGANLLISSDYLSLVSLSDASGLGHNFDAAGRCEVTIKLPRLDPIPLPFHFHWESVGMDGLPLLSQVASLY